MLTDMYLAMKEIGLICGLSQKRIGLALQRLGLHKVGVGPTPRLMPKATLHLGTTPTAQTSATKPYLYGTSEKPWQPSRLLELIRFQNSQPPSLLLPLPKHRPLHQDREARQSYMNKHGEDHDDD